MSWYVALLIGGSALLFLFFPTLFGDPGLIPALFPDAWVTLWSIDWVTRYTVGESDTLYSTYDVFAPDGASLLLHNLSESILLPVVGLGGKLSSERLFTLICLGTLGLNYCASLILFHYASGSIAVGCWLALLFSFHPFILGHLGGGHLNLIVLWPLVLLMYGICRALGNDGSPFISRVIIASCVAFLCYTDLYLLYYAGLFLLVAGIAGRVPYRRFIGDFVGPAAIGGLFGAPKLLPIVRLTLSRQYTPNHNPAAHAIDLLHLILPGKTQAIEAFSSTIISTPATSLNWSESGAYLGITFMGLLLVSRTTSQSRFSSEGKQFLLAGLFFVLLALGPSLNVAEYSVVSLPFYRVASLLPFFPSVPARFMGPAILLLLLGVAMRLPRSSRTLSSLVILSLVEFFPAPLANSFVPYSPAVAALRTSSRDETLVDLGPRELAMYRQTLHKKRIYGGFIARRPRKMDRLAMRNKFVTYLKGESHNLKEAQLALNTVGADWVILDRSSSVALERTSQFSDLEKYSEDPGTIILRRTRLGNK